MPKMAKFTLYATKHLINPVHVPTAHRKEFYQDNSKLFQFAAQN